MDMDQRTNLRSTLFVILLFLLLMPAAAQEFENISMEISPNPVGRGDRFGVTIVVAADDPSQISVEAPDMPEGIVLLRGPYTQPVWVPDSNGIQRKRTKITFLYRSNSTGRFEIGPYRVLDAARVYRTASQLLEVGVYRNRELVIPLEVEWDIEPVEAYVGQNVTCVLKSLEQRDIRYYEEPVVRAPSEGFFQSEEGLGEIRKYSKGSVPLYEIPLGSYIFTPSSEGRVVLPSAQVPWENGRAISGAAVIQVQPLPAPVQSSGAVGDFRMSSRIAEQNLNVGERTVLKVRIEGTGNLNFFQFPDLETDGFTVLSESEESDYSATAQGYHGWREYSYTLMAEESGEKLVRVERLPAVRPESGRIYYVPGAVYRVQVQEAEKSISAGDGEGGIPFEIIPYDDLQTVNVSRRFSQWQEYLWLLPGPILFILALIFKRKKAILTVLLLLFASFHSIDLSTEMFHDSFASAHEAYTAGEFAEAEHLFHTLAEQVPSVPDVRYNAALSALQQNKIGQAVFHTRSAMVYNATRADYSKLLSFIEEQAGISATMDLPFRFHPDFFLFALMILLNAAGFIGIFYLYNRKNSYFIVAMLFAVLSLVFVGGMSFSVIEMQRDTAIVLPSEEAACLVKKIPRSSSGTAFQLAEGEAVHIKGDVEDFFFILTSMEQKGWIQKDCVKKLPQLSEIPLTSEFEAVTNEDL